MGRCGASRRLPCSRPERKPTSNLRILILVLAFILPCHLYFIEHLDIFPRGPNGSLTAFKKKSFPASKQGKFVETHYANSDQIRNNYGVDAFSGMADISASTPLPERQISQFTAPKLPI
jgi:hypothetical protein